MIDVVDFFNCNITPSHGSIIYSARDDEHWSPEDDFFSGEPCLSPAYFNPPRIIWVAEVTCPQCQNIRKTKARGRQRVKCHTCGLLFTASAGTEEKRLNDLTTEDNNSEFIIL